MKKIMAAVGSLVIIYAYYVVGYIVMNIGGFALSNALADKVSEMLDD